jgi:hypothetical protein
MTRARRATDQLLLLVIVVVAAGLSFALGVGVFLALL